MTRPTDISKLEPSASGRFRILIRLSSIMYVQLITQEWFFSGFLTESRLFR
jgi:hypothetical protein